VLKAARTIHNKLCSQRL